MTSTFFDQKSFCSQNLLTLKLFWHNFFLLKNFYLLKPIWASKMFDLITSTTKNVWPRNNFTTFLCLFYWFALHTEPASYIELASYFEATSHIEAASQIEATSQAEAASHFKAIYIIWIIRLLGLLWKSYMDLCCLSKI